MPLPSKGQCPARRMPTSRQVPAARADVDGARGEVGGDFRGFQFSSGTHRRGKRLAIGHSSLGTGVLALSPDYHRRQATALTHLAETTSDPDAAKALLRIASEHIVCADEAERTLALASMKNKDDK